jgi:S-formylglutathione hydrolase FrmB
METYCKEIDSAILGRSIPVRFIVPEGKDLPCLLMLHGYGGNQDQWYSKTDIYQIAVQKKLVIILPGCGDGFYEDTQEDLPRFLAEELIVYAKKYLPISGMRDQTYIAGVSMGGFGALLIGAKYPQVFGKIASFSGAFIIHDVAIGNLGVLGNADVAYFRTVFGDFATLEDSTRDPVAEYIRASKITQIPKLLLLCGKEDVLMQPNLRIIRQLNNAHIPLLWLETDGGHNWPFWKPLLPKVIEWLTDDQIPEDFSLLSPT